MSKLSDRNKMILLIVILALIVAAFAIVYNVFMPKGSAGAKTITVEVLKEGRDGPVKSYKYDTDAAYLGDVLVSEELIEGISGDFGLFITSVDGVKADESQQQWWCITKAGEDVMTGADVTPIADGDKFELTLMTGY